MDLVLTETLLIGGISLRALKCRRQQPCLVLTSLFISLCNFFIYWGFIFFPSALMMATYYTLVLKSLIILPVTLTSNRIASLLLVSNLPHDIDSE